MKFLLVTIGSSGDVHPFIGVGRALQARGHRVSLVTNAHFGSLVRAAGLDFIELGPAEEYLRLTENPDLWHPIRSFAFIAREGFVRPIEPVYRIVKEHAGDRQTVVAASSLAIGARIAQETLGIPLATVHLAPSVLRSSVAPPKLPGMYMPEWYPLWFRRALWGLGDRLVVDPMIMPGVNAFRAQFGLRSARGFFAGWMNSSDLIMGLFPEWFSPIPSDWPACVRLAGFPLFDEEGVTPLDPGVEAFLAAGDPPIVFTPGSAMRFGAKFFAESAIACQRLNRRGILLTRFREQLPASLPPTIKHFDFLPLGRLLPRCAAMVHHGGIGTTAQALASGVPHLVMPFCHDQLDNARRITRMGVGEEIPSKRYAAPRAADALGRLLASDAVKASCRRVREWCSPRDGAARACDILEAFGRSRGLV